MDDPQREALAHRFIARTRGETRAWPARLQIALHELVFVALPEVILALDEPAARAWAQAWRARMEQPAPEIDPADAEWVATLAREWLAMQRPDQRGYMPTAAELARLTDLFARLGPIALQLPWRDEPNQA
ncbi:MAG TPA: hypothetical protein VGF94_05410 [Kofleriaceae bacterium]